MCLPLDLWCLKENEKGLAKCEALFRGFFKDVLFRRYAGGTGAFFALADLELYCLTFLEIRVALGFNF